MMLRSLVTGPCNLNCLPALQLSVMALGFPPFHGGILKYADRVGASEVLQKLDELSALCPWSPFLKPKASLRKGSVYHEGSSSRLMPKGVQHVPALCATDPLSLLGQAAVVAACVAVVVGAVASRRR